MPEVTDITLNYEHPYVAISVVDNTVQQSEQSNAVNMRDFNGIQVGFFPDGRDNRLLYCMSKKAALDEFGNPNYKTHGQAAYNLYNALGTNNCGMYAMNLKPANATHANLVVLIKARVAVTPSTSGSDSNDIGVPTTGGTTPLTPKLYISFETTHIEGATSEAAFRTKLAQMYNNGNLDDDGYMVLPWMAFWRLARGKCGNSTRIRINDSTEYDYDPTEHRYEIQVIQPSSKGLAIVDRKTGVFDENKIDQFNLTQPSEFIEELVNDIEYGSTKINMMFDCDSYDAIISLYNSIDPSFNIDASTLDILFGKQLNGLDDLNIIIEDDGSGSGLFATDGVALSGGSDGDLDGPNAEQVKKELLIAAYNGEIDPRISSRFSTPADFNLDAGYDDDVKRAMAGLAYKRAYDCMTYLDSGLLETNQEVLSWAKGMIDVWGYNVVKESGCFKWRDIDLDGIIQASGKMLPMTITHYLAKALPNHMAVYGLTQPFAKELAIITSHPADNNTPADFVTGTFKPMIDPDMNDIKKEYRRFRVNCYENVYYYSVQRADAITTCREKCERMLEFNEYIVHRMVKIAYDIMASKIYKLGEETDRAAYEKFASQEIEFQLGSLIRKCDVAFVMTEQDAKKGLMRLQLEAVLKRVITNGIVSITINPNTDSTTISSTSSNTVV